VKDERRIADRFRDFVTKRGEYIEDHLSNGWELEKLFYRDFYSTDVDNLKYREEDPETRKLKADYDKMVEMMMADLLKEGRRSRKMAPVIFNEWVNCEINGGAESAGKKGIGRLYLNLKPEQVPGFFDEMAKKIEKSGARVLMQMPATGGAQVFNRFDKMSIQFGAGDEKEILETIGDLDESMFEPQIPRFSAAVKNSEGRFVKGIGFGEDPVFKGQSFGIVRSRILADVYNRAKSFGKMADDPEFDFNGAFKKVSGEYGVDLENPAFNKPKSEGEETFPEMRMRTS